MNAFSPYYGEFLMLLLPHLAAMMAPGADFALVAGQSVRFGKRTGIFCALGIGSGISLHVAYTLAGVGAMLHAAPQLFALVRYVGAAYIAYLAYGLIMSFWRSRTQHAADIVTTDTGEAMSARQSFVRGFLTNALNPKVTVFFVAVFTAIVSSKTPLWVQGIYGAWMSITTMIWFCMVALFLSAAPIRRRFLQIRPLFELGCGLVLLFFAVRMVWAG
ncbi:MAG: LysE family translocator [Neisseria sp.]|nr:LysE family translocator [Neisseria sp.]